jgi:hypothetical protein
VLAWRLSNLLDASFCIEALEDALSRGQPEIFNTDQGSQFTGDDFTGVLRARGVAISMDGRGRFADNILSNGSGAVSSMRRSCAVKALSEMGEGPPESACRRKASNRHKLRG